MTTAVLSLGSNLDDRLGYLRGAVAQLAPWISAVSPVYSTPPWGPVAQAAYLNAIAVVTDAEATPSDWLRRAQACEKAAGRARDVRWGPRTLDVDVICVDDIVSDDPDLTLPHPRAAERAFVLGPWWALDPEAVLPGRGSVLDLLGKLAEGALDQVRMVAGVSLAP